MNSGEDILDDDDDDDVIDDADVCPLQFSQGLNDVLG